MGELTNPFHCDENTEYSEQLLRKIESKNESPKEDGKNSYIPNSQLG